MSGRPTPPPLLGVRTAVILVAGLIFGTIVGVLTALSGQSSALAVVVGLGAAGATIMGLHKVVDA
jgi:hypothetical protein